MGLVFKGALKVSRFASLHFESALKLFVSLPLVKNAKAFREEENRMTTTTSLRLGSSELALNTSSALTDTHDEVSLPYIDDISPRELKAAEVMVKEEVRRRDFFFTRACVRAVLFDRSIYLVFVAARRSWSTNTTTFPTSLTTTLMTVLDALSLYPFLSQMENRCAGCRNAKRTTWLK